MVEYRYDRGYYTGLSSGKRHYRGFAARYLYGGDSIQFVGGDTDVAGDFDDWAIDHANSCHYTRRSGLLQRHRATQCACAGCGYY